MNNPGGILDELIDAYGGAQSTEGITVVGRIGVSISLTFLASVCVTVGLLLYQVFAPDLIRKRDEEEHVRDLEVRYPEGEPQRNDGLRRALEQFDEISKKRSDRHPGLVSHHGELVWFPARGRIEWFDDRDLPGQEQLARAVQRACAVTRRQEAPRDPGEGEAEFSEAGGNDYEVVEASAREGFVPGAERARICIEEGARAEYWLKARQNLVWAWLSLISYVTGMGCLLFILGRQVWIIVRVAGWW